MNRLSRDQLGAGIPVPMDCYDLHGRLVLARGGIIASRKQLDYLLEYGLYALEVASVASPLHALPKLHACYLQLEQIFAAALATEARASSSSPSPSPAAQLADLLNGKKVDAGTTVPDDVHPEVHPFSGQIMQLVAELQALCLTAPDALLAAIHRNQIGARYSIAHALSRAILCELLATRRRIPERNRRQLLAAALTSELSILALQDELVVQQGGLSPDQQQGMAEHPTASIALLATIGAIDPSWTNVILQHHELLNGNGYPGGLTEAEIMPWARIMKIADAYAAMITPQAYRKTLLSKAAMNELLQKRGTEFDDELVVMFVKEVGVLPPGVAVKLRSDEIAIVVQRELNPRAPLVEVVIGPRGHCLAKPTLRKTDSHEHEIIDVVACPVSPT